MTEGDFDVTRLEWTSGWRAVTADDAEIPAPDVTYLDADASCTES